MLGYAKCKMYEVKFTQKQSEINLLLRSYRLTIYIHAVMQEQMTSNG